MRRRVLEVLAQRERTAGEIVDLMGQEFAISQSAVSQHLRVLRENRFARVRRDGTRRIYAIDPTALRKVDAWLEQFRAFWQDRLDALATEVAHGESGTPPRRSGRGRQTGAEEKRVGKKTTAVKEALTALEALGNEKTRAQNQRRGAGQNQFGVKLGDIRKAAKSIGTDHALAGALWDTKNLDARLLAILVIEVKALSVDEVDRMVRSMTSLQVAVWFDAYVLKHHPEKEALRERWMTDHHPMAARSAWFLTAERIVKRPDELDLAALLDRLEADMKAAAEGPQWTMNRCLAEIGIHSKKHRKRALAIGERLGVYRDYPVSKGCTSPFAPIWIREMVKRQSTSPR